jgi:hypothetical protein
MVKTSIAQLAEPIGFDIANSDDTVQADLINGLGRGFKLYNDQNFNIQLSYVCGKINKDGEKFILELAEYIKLKDS